jgi:NAD(P)-dependent dehydrogenase (short-subunit alcohol dehydrogenase family)
VRVLVTGGNGVLGRATLSLLRARGHEVHAPGPTDLDVFDPTAVTRRLPLPTEGRVDDNTPLGSVPEHLHSALAAGGETARFASAGRRGVVLRLGLLDGPGTE